MANRQHRAGIAAQTVEIAQKGTYRAPSGAEVSIRASIERAVSGTQLITPTQSSSLREKADAILAQRSHATCFEVQNETTFSAARRLVGKFGPDKVAALNFASARSPGGGFLGGSQAQEESLARASALYPCLQSQMDYYEANRRTKSLLYTDHVILSPQVPVFRDDDDQLLEQPWEVTIITSPAPNAGAIRKNQPTNVPQIEGTFRRRIEQVLSSAIVADQSALVLGAWGCGVFGNDPNMVANLFGEFLLPGGPFARAFEHITFAVLDRSGETLAAFASVFDPKV